MELGRENDIENSISLLMKYFLKDPIHKVKYVDELRESNPDIEKYLFNMLFM